MLFRSRLVLTLSIILAGSLLPGEDKDPANYPLRIHIFRRSETTFYHNRVADDTKGEGRANGTLMTEPTAVFEDWMIKHAYDPEHGKEVPTETNEPNPAK